MYKMINIVSSLLIAFKLKCSSYQLSRLVVFSLMLSLPGPLLAQRDFPVQYDQQHFTDENGLPQNSVKSIVKDKDGFIWLSTEAGLVRYDGQRFLTFTSAVVPVRSNRMGSFYPAVTNGDNDGNAFFGLSDSYDYLQVKGGNAFVKKSGFENFLAGMPFSSGYNNYNTVIIQSLPNMHKETIAAKTCVVPDASGGFFVCTDKTVSYYQGLKKQYQIDFAVPDFWSFFRMGDSLLWIDSKGVFKRIAADTIHTLLLAGDITADPAYLPGTKNFEVYWNNAAGRVLLYLQKNLYLLAAGAAGRMETKLVLSGFDFETNNIMTAYYDEISQMVFLGSYNKGLFTFSPRQFRTVNIGEADKDNVYYALWPWGNDQVLTTQGNLLGLTKSSVLPAMKKQVKVDKYSMLIDRNGYIWTKDGDYINKFDKEGKNLLSRWDLKGELTQIYEGNDGQIWIGSRFIGLFRVDPSEADPVPRVFSNKPGLANITCMQQVGPDTLWIGTSLGLYRLHLKTGNIDSIKGLEQFYVRSLYISNRGEIWVTTYGAGFFLYSNHTLTHFPEDKERYLAMSHCIVEDTFGFFWISTNKGLFQAAKKDLLNYAQGKQQQLFYLYHTREEGFNTNEFNGGCQPCAAELPNGYIAFPSLDGIVWFAPGSFRTVLPDKNIFIDRIEVDQVPIAEKDTILLSRDFKLLRLYCSTPYAGNAYNINMQYAWVKGKEKEVWLPLADDKIISQSSLKHGVYTLIIRKANGFGGDNYSYRELMVIIPPAFYETWWFYAIAGAFLIFLGWIYTRLRLRYIRRRNIQLESLINERTEELKKTLQALSASEQSAHRQMHIRELLFIAISHDIRSPLKYMSVVAEQLKEALEEQELPDEIKNQAGILYQSGHYLYHLTRNLLQYIRLSEGSTSLKNERFDLHKLIEDKMAIFRTIADERSVAIINKIPENFYLHNDPTLFEVVIHNLLDNAVKVTRSGSVTFHITRPGDKWHLIIEDTGPGMPKEVADYYNDVIPEDKNDGSDDFYPGFGLRIVKELIKEIKMEMEIVTSDKGTAVHLIFGEELVREG
jgi:signal transduction histidine kinase/ligand-binding sensor domain-containing protein